MHLQLFRADPAGNITLFVLSPVEAAARAETAKKLMALTDAEQVAFVLSAPEGVDGAIEMMGGEFCGNAARAYGAYLSTILGKTSLSLRVGALSVAVKVEGESATAQMPLPRAVRKTESGVLVDLGGIVHFVTEEAPSEDAFARIEREVLAETGAEAYGVIFLDCAAGAITPLVKVVSTDTLVWEGSCGSGTLAAAVAESFGTQNGTFSREYVQRAGVISARVSYLVGAIERAYIGGKVAFDAPTELEI